MKTFALGTASLLGLISLASAETLRLGIGTSPGSSYPPYMVLAEDRSYSGLVFDILSAIVKRTGDKIAPVFLPAPRLFAGLSEGTVDIDVFSNPAWRPQYAADSVFTEPYLTTTMILVNRKDVVNVPRTLNDLKGCSVLTVNGFRYPGLDERFETDAIHREVAPSTALLLKMMQANHGSLGIADEAVFVDLVRRENLDALAAGIPVAPPAPVMMRFPKHLAPVVERFNKAIRSLRESGELARILANYGLKPY